MSFFQSEIVQTEMKEISELQEEIYKNVFAFASMTNKDKLEHVEMLESLLKKQQVLYTRLSLSDDPEAQMMKESIMASARRRVSWLLHVNSDSLLTWT
jgi:GTPase Era involved in 16S rRNA processing